MNIHLGGAIQSSLANSGMIIRASSFLSCVAGLYGKCYFLSQLLLLLLLQLLLLFVIVAAFVFADADTICVLVIFYYPYTTGGALYIGEDHDVLTFDDSDFINNVAVVSGGGR